MTLALRAGPVQSAELVRAADASVVALTLSEPVAQNNSWRLRLSAELADGTRGRVGQLITRTIAQAAGAPSRVIGVASCPGAVAWHVETSMLASNVTQPHAELGAAVTPNAAVRAEVLANSVNATTESYRIAAGVGVPNPGTTRTFAAGSRVTAISALRLGTQLTTGYIVISGSDPVPLPPGTAVGLEPQGGIMGPVSVTFIDVDSFEVEWQE